VQQPASQLGTTSLKYWRQHAGTCSRRPTPGSRGRHHQRNRPHLWWSRPRVPGGGRLLRVPACMCAKRLRTRHALLQGCVAALEQTVSKPHHLSCRVDHLQAWLLRLVAPLVHRANFTAKRCFSPPHDASLIFLPIFAFRPRRGRFQHQSSKNSFTTTIWASEHLFCTQRVAARDTPPHKCTPDKSWA